MVLKKGNELFDKCFAVKRDNDIEVICEAPKPNQQKILKEESPPYYSVGIARGYGDSTPGEISSILQGILGINGFSVVQGPLFRK